MSGVEQQPPTFQFGVFELDPEAGELRKRGVRLKLQEQPLQILTLLLERPGEVVTREEMQKRLWPEGTYVDFDNAINSAIRKLRDALGDSPENPRFVETLARRGYRFIGMVSARPEPTRKPKISLPAVVATGRLSRVIAVAVAVVGLGAALAMWLERRSYTTNDADLRVRPFTSDPGVQIQPSFSPDSTQVAYAWNGPDEKTFGIYVKGIGSGDPVRITDAVTPSFSPAWSPDARRIAALRVTGVQGAIVLIPASGGPPAELTRLTKGSLGAGSCNWLPIPVNCGIPPSGSLLAWSPDGKYLFTSGSREPESPPAILRVSVKTGEQSLITAPPGGSVGDIGPALSPDGLALAFVRASGSAAGELFVVTLSKASQPLGPPRQVTFDGALIDPPVWTPNGRELVFASDRGGRRGLWRVLASGGGKPARVAGAGDNAYGVAISPRGHLVYGQRSESRNLWKVPIRAGKGGEPVRVTATTKRDTWADYSPDGHRIAFESDRSGVHEIWVCDADGSNVSQLTNFGKGWSGSPQWSPDGLTVTFDSNVAGSWDVYLIHAEGGTPLRLTTSPATDTIPTWSHDGHWIYFSSNRTARHEIWKMRPDGSAEMQVTTSGGMVAVESVDGKTLYYKNEGPSEIWKMPLRGGTATKVLDSAMGRLFTVTERGLYFPGGSVAKTDLRFLNFANHSVHVVSPLGDWWGSATLSPDERWALYPRKEFLHMNLMLVENFR